MSNHPELKIEFSRTDNAELVALDAELRECEEIRNQLVDHMAEIDSSIQKYKESLYSTSENCFNISGKAFSNVSDRRMRAGKMNKWDKANLTVGAISAGVGAVTGAVGFASSHIKEYVAKKKYEKAMDALLEKKIALAEEKLPYVAEIYDKMTSGPFVRMEKLYSSLFGLTISGEYDMLCKQISMFKSSFGMALKARLLSDSFAYMIAEMKTWLNGSHDSDYQQKSASDIFYEEVETWPRRFGFQNWDELSEATYESDDSSIRLPMAFVFSNPFMLSEFAKIRMPSDYQGTGGGWKVSGYLLNAEVTREIEGRDNIQYIGRFNLKDTIAASLIRENDYFKSCSDVLRNSFVFPKKPRGFGFDDILVILLEIGVPVGYVFGVFALFGWFFRILFLIAPIVYICHDPDKLDFLAEILPVNRRKERYREEYEMFRNEVYGRLYNVHKSTIKL